MEKILKNTNKKIYDKMLNSSYFTCCELLKEKYGRIEKTYFYNEINWCPRQSIKRSKEGLEIHHIKEDCAIMLSTKEYACKKSFEWQKGDYLVYCNLIEHLILHIKIVEATWEKCKNEIYGIGGILNFIVPQLNDFFSGFSNERQHIKQKINAIINDYDYYMKSMRYFFYLVNRMPLKKKINYLGSVFTSFNAFYNIWEIKKNMNVFCDLEKIGFAYYNTWSIKQLIFKNRIRMIWIDFIIKDMSYY